ncbi:MAG TPA: cytochrome c oxidase assembly protein [Gemmatimonadales bacterium]|nr:cytochrome c oxidase assembly protein [Gemmatimonadales bacterium]
MPLPPWPLALAHADARAPAEVLRTWSFEPGVVLPLAIVLLPYLAGMARPPRLRGRRRALRHAAFLAGWLILTLSLVSPLAAMGEALFSAHMAQHELLMVLAAPLLVVARPLQTLLRGLPPALRRAAARALARPLVRRSLHLLALPAVAFVIHSVAVWVWHVPALFDETLHSETVHAAQHLSFFGTAVLFWWALWVGPRGRPNHGVALFLVFLIALHTGALSALLFLSSSAFYPAYAASAPLWGLTPLEDQQLGGLIMWVPGGLAYVVAAVAIGAVWLRDSERRAEARLRPGELALRGPVR